MATSRRAFRRRRTEGSNLAHSSRQAVSAGARGRWRPKVAALAGIVLNSHYRSMRLYGSEYWTYTLPRRVGPMRALKLTESCQPIGAQAACQIGFIDDAFAMMPGRSRLS